MSRSAPSISISYPKINNISKTAQDPKQNDSAIQNAVNSVKNAEKIAIEIAKVKDAVNLVKTSPNKEYSLKEVAIAIKNMKNFIQSVEPSLNAAGIIKGELDRDFN